MYGEISPRFLLAVFFQIHCALGFEVWPPGSGERVCQSNGRWSGLRPRCRRIRCPRPQEIPNAIMEAGKLTVGGVTR